MNKLKQITEYGPYLLAFLLPWQTRWIWHTGVNEYSVYSLYGTDLLIVLLWALCFLNFRFWILDFGINAIRNFNPKSAIQNPKFLLLVFNLLALSSIIWSPDKSLALFAYLRLSLMMSLVWLIGRLEFDWVKLAWAFVGGASLSALLGLYQFLSQTTFANKWLGLASHNPADLGVSVIETISGGRWLRAYGGLDHPNMMGGYLGVSILFTLWLILNLDDIKFRSIFNFQFSIFNEFLITKFLNKHAILYVSLIVQVFALLFTFSRGAWLGLLVGLAVFVALNRQYWLKLVKISLLAIIVILPMAFVFREPVLTRLWPSGRLEIKSNEERLNTLAQGWQVFKTSPFLGVGIGNYTTVLGLKMPGHASYYYQPAHNTLLLILAELGVVGGVLFILLILLILNFEFRVSIQFLINKFRIQHLFKIQNSKFKIIGGPNLERELYFSLLTVLLAVSLFDHYLFSLHFGLLLFWLIIGLAIKDFKDMDDCSVDNAENNLAVVDKVDV